MEKFDVKIFESYMSNEAFNRVKEELDKNPEFYINNDNITEFIDCKLVLDILKEHKIEYKIIVNDRWSSRGGQYDLIVCIYISQKDFVLIRHLLETEKEVEYEEDGVENDKIAKRINLIYSIFINFICFAIGIPFIILGIMYIGEDMDSMALIIIGVGIIIFRIAKIIRFINKKFTKKL